MIDDRQVESYLAALAGSDEKYGLLWGQVEATEHIAKQAEALAFLKSGGTVAERQSAARTEPKVKDAWEAHANAIADYRTLQAQRKTAERHIDVWRTQSASRRQGNV